MQAHEPTHMQAHEPTRDNRAVSVRTCRYRSEELQVRHDVARPAICSGMPPTSKHDTVQTSDFAAPVVDRNQHMHNSDSVARRLRAAFLGTVLLAALSAPVESGAQGSVGFRSGFTEGNGIPPRGRVDVDYGGSAIDAGRMRAYTAGEVVAHIPLSRRAGLRLHVNSYAWVTTPQARATGREDIGVGSAFIVRSNAGWRPATALLTRIDLPSGSLPGVGNGWRPTVKVALGWRLPAGVALSSNIGLATIDVQGDRYTQQFGSLWLGRNITRRLGSFGEVFAFDREAQSGPSTSYLRGGFTVLITKAIHLDLNASTQLGSAAPRRTLGIGVKHRM